MRLTPVLQGNEENIECELRWTVVESRGEGSCGEPGGSCGELGGSCGELGAVAESRGGAAAAESRGQCSGCPRPWMQAQMLV